MHDAWLFDIGGCSWMDFALNTYPGGKPGSDLLTFMKDQQQWLRTTVRRTVLSCTSSAVQYEGTSCVPTQHQN